MSTSFPLRRRRRTARSLGRQNYTRILCFVGGGLILTLYVVWKTNVTLLSISSSPSDNSMPPLPPSLSMQQQQQSSIYASNQQQRRPNRIVNGWEQLRPKKYGATVYGEEDDFLQGKSCHWQSSGILGQLLSKLFFFARYSFAGQWECRDCGTDSTNFNNSWKDCPLLHRRGKCYPFRFQGWDDDPQPRVSSSYDSTSADPHPTQILTSYGVGKVQTLHYHQPKCHHLTKPCFDMDRCTMPERNATHRKLQDPLLVYAYSGIAEQDLKTVLDDLLETTPPSMSNVRIATTVDPSTACLLIVHVKDLSSAQDTSTAQWNNGVNHYVYGITKPIERKVYYDMAALGSAVMTNAQLRIGYDIPLPLPALWSPPKDERFLQLQNWQQHRPRKWLLSFKGSIQDTLQPYYQHRWIAAEYWHNGDDVAIDVQCKHKGLLGDLTTVAPYDHPSPQHFDNLMLNSTFAFCPGGSHVTSYRFTEVLSTGSIPVLLPEVVPPFWPELDWSQCVVWVSQARIVDLPRLLRSMDAKEVKARQTECQRLYHILMMAGKRERDVAKSSSAPANNFLATALSVWHVRIQKQHMENQLHLEYFGGR